MLDFYYHLVQKAREHINIFVDLWNKFFDPNGVLEQERMAAIPDFQLDFFIAKAIHKELSVDLQIKVGSDIENVTGQIFQARRQPNAIFLTQVSNQKVTRIIFKDQIVSLSLADNRGGLELDPIMKKITRLRKTS